MSNGQKLVCEIIGVLMVGCWIGHAENPSPNTQASSATTEEVKVHKVALINNDGQVGAVITSEGVTFFDSKGNAATTLKPEGLTLYDSKGGKDCRFDRKGIDTSGPKHIMMRDDTLGTSMITPGFVGVQNGIRGTLIDGSGIGIRLEKKPLALFFVDGEGVPHIDFKMPNNTNWDHIWPR